VTGCGDLDGGHDEVTAANHAAYVQTSKLDQLHNNSTTFTNYCQSITEKPNPHNGLPQTPRHPAPAASTIDSAL
jgi:hypothetical protein